MFSMQSVARYLYAPAMLLGLNGLGLWLVSHGYPYWTLAVVFAVALGTVFLAERVSPVHDEWNHSHDDGTVNTVHAVVYEISNINAILLMPIIAWLVPWDGIWPHGWPLVAQVLLAIVLADFAFSMVHYFSHRIPLLWRLHAVHHGVPRMYGFNGLVRHPLHQTLDLVVGSLPLALAGMSMDVAVLLGLAVSIQLLVQHSNVDYALGPFRNHLAIGRLHHLHHVNWGKEGDVNFGLFFTLWDRMLGTLVLEPSRPIKSSDLGIDDDPSFPQTYWQHLIYPFYYTPGAGVAARKAAAEAAKAQSDAASDSTALEGKRSAA